MLVCIFYHRVKYNLFKRVNFRLHICNLGDHLVRLGVGNMCAMHTHASAHTQLDHWLQIASRDSGKGRVCDLPVCIHIFQEKLG